MKKIILITLIILLLLNLCGCNTKTLSVEQSKRNFVQYQSSMDKIIKSYGYQMKKIFDENYKDDKESIIREFEVKVSDFVQIYIRFENSSGREAFVIDFVSSISNLKDKNRNIDIPLFVKLTNVISGKEISEDDCIDFLEAPEEKYSSSGYYSGKLEGDLVRKITDLDFWGNWTIEYNLSKDNTETFGIGGLTNQLED